MLSHNLSPVFVPVNHPKGKVYWHNWCWVTTLSQCTSSLYLWTPRVWFTEIVDIESQCCPSLYHWVSTPGHNQLVAKITLFFWGWTDLVTPCKEFYWLTCGIKMNIKFRTYWCIQSSWDSLDFPFQPDTLEVSYSSPNLLFIWTPFHF